MEKRVGSITKGFGANERGWVGLGWVGLGWAGVYRFLFFFCLWRFSCRGKFLAWVVAVFSFPS